MSENVIHVRSTRYAIRQAVGNIPQGALGSRGAKAAANAMLTRCGLALLGRIRKAFIEKARGGTDEAGESWKPLSPKTIAYSRRHPGLPKSKQRAAKRPSYALTAKQRKRWWTLYSQGLAMFRGDKGSAAKRAWAILKSEGAETLLSRYGNAQVEILRDSGLLLNSLSPGVSSSNQILRVGRGDVIVGTNRKGAAGHHNGIPGRLPQRRLWPPPHKWPSSWWLDVTDQAKQGLVDIAILLVNGGR